MLGRKLKKARGELERVQGIYETLLKFPSVEGLNVRDHGKKIIDDITKEGRGIIGDLRKAVAALKKGKQVSSGATQTSPQQVVVPILENVIQDMEIVVEQVSRKRKRGGGSGGQLVPKRQNTKRTNENAIQLGPSDRNPNVNFGGPNRPGPSLLKQAISISSPSSSSSSRSIGSVFSPGSSPSGSSEGSGGFDRRAMDLR